MIQISKILLPTDFSPCAHQALTHALLLAEQFGAELTMLHALVLRSDDPYNPAYHFAEPDEIFRRLEEISHSEMAQLIEPHLGKELTIHEVEVRGLYPGPVIVDYAKDNDVDLIVMGTHGRRGPAHLLLGSVAEEVVRHAPCPVLTVRRSKEPRQVEAIERILVPVDFSESSKQSLALACDLARTYGARLELLHVVEELMQPGFYGPVEGVGPITDHAAVRERSRGALERLLSEVGGGELPSSARILFGRPGYEIVTFAEEQEVDLVVIATHGLTGLKRLLFGSVAEQVVRGAPCPVFTVKSFGRRLGEDD